MRFLLLDGHGINLKVDNAKLHIRNGDNIETIYPARRIGIDHIIVYGRDGNITFDAIRWLMKHTVQITYLDWNGSLLTTMLPNKVVKVDTKFEQYKLFEDRTKRIGIARLFLLAKFQKTKLVLDYLKERYPEVDTNFDKLIVQFEKAKTLEQILLAEGLIASHYWRQFKKVIPDKYEFEGREYQQKSRTSGDQVNTMLNFGYAILEAEVLKSINSVGFDVHIGFLHEKKAGKNSLAYDLQEPFRFLIDLAVLDLIENNTMTKSDFIRTDNYNLRLRSTGAKKVLESINKWFNKKVTYMGDENNWHYIILLKIREFAQFISYPNKKMDFTNPNYTLNRKDAVELRDKIQNISYVDWKKKGLSKGTLHYIKQNAKSEKPFYIKKNTKDIIANW